MKKHFTSLKRIMIQMLENINEECKDEAYDKHFLAKVEACQTYEAMDVLFYNNDMREEWENALGLYFGN